VVVSRHGGAVSWCHVVEVSCRGGAAPTPWRCRAVEEPRSRRGGATPSRSRGDAPSRSHVVEEPWCRAVEDPRPCRRGAAPMPWCRVMEKEGGSKVAPPWMGERERVVAAALNLGEMEMNRERESMGENQKSRMLLLNMCGRRERERKMDLHMCEKTHNPCDTFSDS
jgi:hypothetical protein